MLNWRLRLFIFKSNVHRKLLCNFWTFVNKGSIHIVKNILLKEFLLLIDVYRSNCKTTNPYKMFNMHEWMSFSAAPLSIAKLFRFFFLFLFLSVWCVFICVSSRCTQNQQSIWHLWLLSEDDARMCKRDLGQGTAINSWGRVKFPVDKNFLLHNNTLGHITWGTGMYRLPVLSLLNKETAIHLFNYSHLRRRTKCYTVPSWRHSHNTLCHVIGGL